MSKLTAASDRPRRGEAYWRELRRWVLRTADALSPGSAPVFVSKCHAMKAQNRSLLHHCVRLAFLDDIDDEQLERAAPDVGAHVPLPYRFEDEISWFIGIVSTSLHVGHPQLPR